MSNIYKLAQNFEKKLVLASNKAYETLAMIHDKALGIAADPYGDMADQVKRSAEDLLRAASLLADKAWREGLSAEELSHRLDGVKSKANNVAISLSVQPNKDRSAKVADLMHLASVLTPVAIPAQKPQTTILPVEDGAGVAQEAAPDDSFEPSSQNFYLNRPMSDKLMDVVKNLEPKYTDPSVLVDWESLKK